MSVIVFIIKCIYLILPGMFANMAPSVMKKSFKFLAVPIDFNKKLKGKPILGKNKTYRGLIFGIIFSIIITFVQTQLYRYEFFTNLSFIDYSQYNFVLLGFLIGFGVLFGDAAESFVKRRFNIKPGEPFFPWDQLDGVIGGLLFVSIVYVPPLTVIITIIVLAFVFHIIFKHIGYYLKIDNKKW